MPERKTLERAARDKRQGKSASTQAGEFIREEIEHVRAGKHGVRSTKQAVAIGLSKARRAGVKLPAPKHASAAVKRKAEKDLKAAGDGQAKSRSRARAAAGAEEKRPPRIAPGALAPGQRGRQPAQRRRPFRRRAQSRPNQRRGRPERRCQEGRAHPRRQPPGAPRGRLKPDAWECAVRRASSLTRAVRRTALSPPRTRRSDPAGRRAGA